MKELNSHRIFALSIILLLGISLIGLSACNLAPQSTEQVSLPATVDINAIANRVLDQIEADPPLARIEPTQEPLNVDALVEQVASQVQNRLDQAVEPTPEINSQAMAAMAGTLEGTLIELYKQANPATVYVVVPPIGSGSGFVFDAEGHIVTNNHVVEGGESFEIVFAGGQRQRATLVGTDVDSDLAVLKVDELPAGVTPLPLADPESISVGQFVIAIGNPFGEQGSMSLGIISGLGRSLPSQRQVGLGTSYSLPEVIQTDAPINPGNSGGPLLNLAGEVVGINAAIATASGTNSGVGFSIPVAAVARIVPELIANGEYVYPFMGTSFDGEISLDDLERYGLSQPEGAYVVSIQEGGPADRAGLVAANPQTGAGGDLVIQIDDQGIRNFDDLNSYLVFHTSVGQQIEITVLRDGEEAKVLLTLGERP